MNSGLAFDGFAWSRATFMSCKQRPYSMETFLACATSRFTSVFDKQQICLLVNCFPLFCTVLYFLKAIKTLWVIVSVCLFGDLCVLGRTYLTSYRLLAFTEGRSVEQKTFGLLMHICSSSTRPKNYRFAKVQYILNGCHKDMFKHFPQQLQPSSCSR